MAFHLACPITCEKICFCELGFGGETRRRAFEEEVQRLETFLRDPWSVRAPETVARVLVPKIEVLQTQAAAEEDAEEWSAQAKRAALQRKAAAASVAAEDYIRKLEAGVSVALEDVVGEAAEDVTKDDQISSTAKDVVGEAAEDVTKEDQISSTAKVMCRICFSGENEGSEKARKMLSCKLCSKKYHKSCVRTWADNRDLFHWSFWSCPSCRICEVCRRTGDHNKFMFCKRCDAAYHCYCLQPPHKNVGHGPYLCPRHTRCHSCGSTVHGSGHSTRWFLGYNFCDACGRLFTKEKYCPVCLKVYRDSESTPMVCCDVCQRWVHCSCDGISDEKYLQFQSDRNLYYKCAACRGDCYQVKDVDDAVKELWRRRDKADHDLIMNLRIAAGLPSHDDFYSVSPSDEDDGPIFSKSDNVRTLKFSVKGLSDKGSKSTSEQGKKVSKKLPNKKPVKKKDDAKDENMQNLENIEAALPLESGFVEEKASFSYNTVPASATSSTKLKFSVDNSRHENSSFKEDVEKCFENEAKNHDLRHKEANTKHDGKNEPVKGTKLVIHLGGKNRNVASSPMSEASSCHREQEKALSNGRELSSQHKANVIDRPALNKHGGNIYSLGEEGSVAENNHRLENIDRKIVKDGVDLKGMGKSNSVPDEGQATVKKPIIFRRRRATETPNETATLMTDKTSKGANPKVDVVGSVSEQHYAADPLSLANSKSKELKPLLKLKFKNPQLENQGLPSLDGEMSIVKGQRSKRKRPSTMPEKTDDQGIENCINLHREDRMDEAIDANWILQRLGKDAVGKRVEIQISGDNWKKGVVSELVGGTTLSVDLDNGKSRTLELGKQGIRLIPQKQKWTKL